MPTEQQHYLDKLNSLNAEFLQTLIEYWNKYSHMGTWQFWVNFAFLFLPLVAFYLFIDRRKILQLSFYGFTFHVLVAYLDSLMNKLGYWGYPYMVLPYLSNNLSIDASLIPISYIFAYQYSINHKKNFYVISLILSLFYGFVFAGTLQMFDFFVLNKGMNSFYVFLIDLGLGLTSYWFTNMFVKTQEKAKIKYGK